MTVARRDAGAKPTGTYSRRVIEVAAERWRISPTETTPKIPELKTNNSKPQLIQKRTASEHISQRAEAASMTVARRDAGAKPTGTYSRRVIEVACERWQVANAKPLRKMA